MGLRLDWHGHERMGRKQSVMAEIDLSDPDAVRRATDAQVKRRARLFLECAIENALAAHDGDGEAVAEIVAEMIDHMRQ